MGTDVGPFVRIQVGIKRLLWRDLLSLRFYARRLKKQGFARAVTSFVHTKIPRAFPLRRLPYVLVVEPTTHCNLRCVMCPSPGFQSPRGYMSMAVYEKVLGEAVAGGVLRIRFVGLGEPLMHPDLPEMIRKAKRGGLYTEVSTNATLLTRELGAALLEAGLDEIGFSLDSADEAEYERIRKGGDYQEVIRNVDAFLHLCAADRSRAPITVARMVVSEQSNVDAFSHRWRDKVDSLQFNTLRVYAETGTAKKIERGLIPRPGMLQLRRKPRCRQILHHLLVCWDGSVSLCNQASVLIGDTKTSSLEAIWRSHAIERVRQLHARYEGDRVDVCRACPVMESVVSPHRPHQDEGRVAVRAPWRDDQVDGNSPGLVQLRRAKN